MNRENLLEKLQQEFFTVFFMQLACLCVITLYIVNFRKSKNTFWLALLALTSFLQECIFEYSALQPDNLFLGRGTIHNSIYLYLIIEITCCSFFLKTHIRSGIWQKVILAECMLFIAYLIGHWIIVPYNTYFPQHIEIIEGFIIIIPCLYFFYERFTLHPAKSLFFEPSSGAISGMLLLFSSIMPLFLMLDYLHEGKYQSLFTINNIAYTILFITFLITIANNRSISSEKGV